MPYPHGSRSPARPQRSAEPRAPTQCEVRIGRAYGAQEGNAVRLDVTHTGRRIAVVEFSLADFTKAIMGELVIADLVHGAPESKRPAPATPEGA
jgi:hypothetical protein